MKMGSVVLAALVFAAAPVAALAGAAPPAAVADPASDAANQAVVESLYRAFAAGDGPGIASVLDTNLIWVEAENGPYADRNPYVGPAAVFEGIFGRMGAAFTGFAATPNVFLPSGDRVVVLGRYTGRNNATGESLDAQFAHVFTVSNGKVTAFQQYTDTAQWVDVVSPN
ncbi:MAG: nuclear transport factor 2 family protein [Brevundimonas sp.]